MYFQQSHQKHALYIQAYALQGMLSIGAAMLGSSHVVGMDVDADALQIAQSNVEEFEDLRIGVHDK